MTNITPTWTTLLATEKQKPYFKAIKDYLAKERASNKTVYPEQKNIFNAIKLTPFEQIKVVIIGQDPYHNPGQAHGLCFSVQNSVKPPPSLQNIFKEIEADLGIKKPNHGNLESWAKQGVMLLNATLTVRAHQPQSHSKIGWQHFTDKVIEIINANADGVVFLLWGASAQSKAKMIDMKKHHVLKAPHPSPLSAHRGFLGCKHFSKCNRLLKGMGKDEIDWEL